MSRALVPHCREDVDRPFINSFYCSNCKWSHSISPPKPHDKLRYQFSYSEVSAVCHEFEQHRCEDFEKRTISKQNRDPRLIWTCQRPPAG